MRDENGRFIKGGFYKKGEGYWKDKKLTNESKEKISKKLKGRKLPDETRIRMSQSRTGKPQLWHKGIELPLSTRIKMGISHKGEKHWNWQGGISDKNERARKCLDYKIWRDNVLERDLYTCQNCKKSRGWDKKLKKRIVIEADHIKSFSLFPELRYEVGNGRALCKDCHKKTDTWGSRSRIFKLKANT